MCNDSLGYYDCTCPTGFTGHDCETSQKHDILLKQLLHRLCQLYCLSDIDDCTGNPCQANADCIDGIDTYTCKCQAGYTGLQCETGYNQSHYTCNEP